MMRSVLQHIHSPLNSHHLNSSLSLIVRLHNKQEALYVVLTIGIIESLGLRFMGNTKDLWGNQSIWEARMKCEWSQKVSCIVIVNKNGFPLNLLIFDRNNWERWSALIKSFVWCSRSLWGSAKWIWRIWGEFDWCTKNNIQRWRIAKFVIT